MSETYNLMTERYLQGAEEELKMCEEFSITSLDETNARYFLDMAKKSANLNNSPAKLLLFRISEIEKRIDDFFSSKEE